MKKGEGAAGSVLGGGSFRTKRRCVWLVISLKVEETELLVGKRILVRSWERDGAKRPVRFLELLMEKMVALGQKGVYTWVKVQVSRVGGLCLGIHGTWRAGGADAGEGAARSVSGKKEPVWFLE